MLSVCHSSFFILFYRREARWYHGAAVYCGRIYWLGMCASLWALPSGADPLPSAWVFSLQSHPKRTVSEGWRWQQNTHSLQRGWSLPAFWSLLLCISFLLVLKWLWDVRQPGCFHVVHYVGEKCVSCVISHCINNCRWCGSETVQDEGLKIW